MSAAPSIDREANRRAKDLVAVLEPHGTRDVSIGAVRVFLQTMDASLQAWVAATPTDDVTRAELRVLTIQNSFTVFWGALNRSVSATTTALLSAWADAARVVHVPAPSAPPPREERLVAPTLDALVTFEAGVLEYICGVVSQDTAAGIIRRLMAHLQLSYDELGRIVGATGETIRRWEQGRNAVPPEKQAMLTTADAALSRLLTMVKADALPAAIRRPADAFGDERAIDWILRGRIADVVNRYDRALRYQE